MADSAPYFRQLLAGRDFARESPYAGQMANFVYLIGDPATRQALVVDPAWDVRGLVEVAASDGYTLAGALVTHYHPDHIGGRIFGIGIEGAAELLAQVGLKFHVHKHEADGVRKVTGLSASDLVTHDDGDIVKVGDVEVRLMHTPGHTPGSQCFLLGDRVVSGDTLFIQGCGRVDLPGADPAAMWESLTNKLARLPDDTVLYPGHDYSDTPTATMGDQKRRNHYLRVPTLAAWMNLMATR